MNFASGKRLFNRLPATAADHHLGAGQIERQKGFEILLDCDPPDAREDRPRKRQFDRAVGPEQLGVDAAGHMPRLEKAARCELRP